MHPYLYQGAQQQQQQQQQPLPQSFNQQDFYGAAAGGQPLQPPTSMAGYQQMMAMQQQQQHQQQQHHHQRQASNQMTKDEEKIFSLVQDVLNPDLRENALLELSKRRETFEDLAPILWYSYGVIAVLLQEVVSIFPYLSPPTLSTQLSNRVCNTLALLQCVASHPDTRGPCLSVSRTRPFEYLRLTSLGVIGALNDNPEVISFLLQTEIIPLCLRIMESGTEISKTVAIFILQKILLDDLGLNYICQTYERFYAVGTVLNNLVSQMVEQPSLRILKHVVRCYLRLTDNPRAREALRQCLPDPLKDGTFSQILKDDTVTKRCLAQLALNLSDA